MFPCRIAARAPADRDYSIQKGTRVLISLWDSPMFGRVPGTRPNISESHSEISTRVPFSIAVAGRDGTRFVQRTHRASASESELQALKSYGARKAKTTRRGILF